jgi:membrane protein YdbS with pleckstrin-like domain
LPICIFVFVWVTGFFGGLLTLIISNIFIQTSPFLPLLIGAIVIVTTIILIFVGEAKRFKHTEFLFFEDRFTWKSEGLQLDEGTVYYKEIKAIESRTSMLQSCYSLGNLYLSLSSPIKPISKIKENFNPTFLFKNFFAQVDHNNFLYLFDLPNAQEAFEQVVTVIHRSNTAVK